MFTAVHLIPTGVGAAIGGFAGDGGPATKLLASVVDCLVTHPNAVNGAQLLALPANALYLEGAALDSWLAGRRALRPVKSRRIGLLIDRAVEHMPAGSLDVLIHAVDAVRSVHGVPILGWELTPRPLGARTSVATSGLSEGSLQDPDALLDGARALMASGAEAIAVVADLGPLDPTAAEAYDQGQGVDPIGGLEAIISHLLVETLGVPAAHAPLWPYAPSLPVAVDPRAAAEHLGHTFLPCILMGLAKHPELLAPEAPPRPGDLGPAAADAIVLPQGCLGGPGALAGLDRGIPLVVVEENTTLLEVTPARLGLGPAEGVWPVRSYWEAAGLLAAWRLGLDARTARRPMPALQRLSPPLHRPTPCAMSQSICDD
ncbi:MAG: DUF3326 domain-containing protein [Candidatus Sericytochromatia bacterium]|nr:DUF3326 domain-containing protein [Candidatus Sericytochromatia bacterium]